jgi:hypothetical protein
MEPIDTGGQVADIDTGVNDTFEQHCAATGEKPVFDVSSTVPGRVDVRHTGFELEDCGEYHVFISKKEEWWAVLEYGRVGEYAETCPGTCVFTFNYEIGAEDGDWTFELLLTGELRTVTVR